MYNIYTMKCNLHQNFMAKKKFFEYKVHVKLKLLMELPELHRRCGTSFLLTLTGMHPLKANGMMHKQ
jgi:hypothetical protein